MRLRRAKRNHHSNLYSYHTTQWARGGVQPRGLLVGRYDPAGEPLRVHVRHSVPDRVRDFSHLSVFARYSHKLHRSAGWTEAGKLRRYRQLHRFAWQVGFRPFVHCHIPVCGDCRTDVVFRRFGDGGLREPKTPNPHNFAPRVFRAVCPYRHDRGHCLELDVSNSIRTCQRGIWPARFARPNCLAEGAVPRITGDRVYHDMVAGRFCHGDLSWRTAKHSERIDRGGAH